jgi:hypothetical protein
MLIEQAASVKRRWPAKWLWIGAGATVLAAAIGMAVLVTHWPFRREALMQALEAASGRQVEIRSFSRTYVPPGCSAEGIRFLRHKHPGEPPIITVERLVIRGSFLGLVSSPTRLADVRVVGMHMIVSPKATGEDQTSVLLNSGPGGLEISRIVADGAVLEFLPEDRKNKPYVLRIERLAVNNVGSGTRMEYRTTVRNTVPPGVIRAEGKFGPWNPSDLGATPVSGRYTYDDIDLSAFESIAGKGHAKGQFSGPLSRIETRGSVDVEGFHVDGGHAVPLATTFEATVNGTNGDVWLTPAVTRYRRTQIEVRGSIAGGAGQGKTASFDVAIPQGRVDDLLYLFTKGPPGMSGNVKVNGKFLWPPGPRKFLEQIRMDLTFGMRGSQFTSSDTQNSVNRISESAQGETKKEDQEDPRTVLSAVSGSLLVRDGVASVSGGSFEVPGADATVDGTYNLLNQRVNLHGTLNTGGHLSDTTSGFKALILKAVTPFFRKRKSVRVIPFEITGAYGNTSVGIDWKKGLLRK